MVVHKHMLAEDTPDSNKHAAGVEVVDNKLREVARDRPQQKASQEIFPHARRQRSQSSVEDLSPALQLPRWL
jgi:hypothetical protein